MNFRKLMIAALGILFILIGTLVPVFAHCQVPCGIYDDAMRIKMISEHITTIEKAMNQIETLSSQQPVNYNQIVRWVVNKEKHAEELSDIVTYYFMAQRVSPPDREEGEGNSRYLKQLTLLHRILVTTMKAKQTVDRSHIARLRSLLKEFEETYFHSH